MAIPQHILASIVSDGWYQKCCLCGSSPVQFHHHMIYAGRAVQEKFAILPLCPNCHRIEKRKDINDKLTLIMLNRATDEELRRYSKIVDLIGKRRILNQSSFSGVQINTPLR